MNKSPLISIIIPVFNRERLVVQTLDSVLAQTYSNWECIVVEDGSTDDSWKVLQRYASKDKRINVIRRNRYPKGAPTCRNVGVDLSNGEYLIFLDSDDLLAPWALKTRLEIIQNTPKLDMVLSNGAYFNSITKSFLHYTTDFNCKTIIEYYRMFKMVLQTTAVTWNKQFFINNNIAWNEKIISWQDTDLFIRSFSLCPNFQWADELPDYFSRQENDKFSITSSSNIVFKTIDNFNTYENWLQNKKNKVEFKQHFPTFMLFRIEYFMTSIEIKNLVKEIKPKLYQHFKQGIIIYLWLYRKTRNIPVLKGLTYRVRFFLTGAKKNVYGKAKKQLTPEVISLLQKKYFEISKKNLDYHLWGNHL